MDVRGIGAAGYPAAAFDPKWVRDNAAGGNFAKQVAEAAQEKGQAAAVLHGAEEGAGDTTVGAWADVVSGSSISVKFH